MFSRGGIYGDHVPQTPKDEVKAELHEEPGGGMDRAMSEEVKAKARELGLDLNDPKVQQCLMQLKKRSEGLSAAEGAKPKGFHYFEVMLNRDRWFTVPWFMYMGLSIHCLYRLFKMCMVIPNVGRMAEGDPDDVFQSLE
ncbi:unnamed protein product [Ostreobium quekettii]|uniref:Uncharacterized protein n=1 Tax=Ostreobium quekettii TaxID=121088 RepID=A0A8S1IW70_9CHLO|nr:unnamed protein product [Ostreobium quekettii]